jgi:hypothetical protein
MYWEFVILARKLGIVAVSVGLRNSASYQLAMMLLVLFAAFSLQVKHNPYFSHGDRPIIISEHEQKVLEGDPAHVHIADDIRAMAKLNSRKGTRVQRFFDTRTLARSPVDAAVLALLDYNTVESVLLGSGILVCLAGLMFSSSRFTTATASFYQVCALL